jgi:hypothetical protein
MKKLILISILFFCCAIIHAQTGELSITATGDATPITLDHVEKKSDPAQTKDTTLPTPAFNYNIQPKRYITTVKLDTIRAAKISSEPLPKLYRTYARIGVGNYSTFMGEFSLASMRSKTGAWGAHVNHFSAGSGPKNVAGKTSGFATDDIDIFGKRFLKHHILYGGLDYNRDLVYNYGSVAAANQFDVNSTRQHFNYFSLNGQLKSHLTDSAALNHQIDMRYYHLGDRYKTKEDNFLMGVNVGRYIRTERIDFALGVDYNHNAGDHDTVNNTIVSMQPMFSSRGAKYNVAIGIGLAIDAGTDTKTSWYPQATFSYDFINHILVPYMTLGGYLERNSYRTLSTLNPFLITTSAFALRNTQHKYELTGGLRGSLTSEIVYDVNASRVELVNAPFFVNTTFAQDVFQNKFSVVYDTVTVTNVHAQLGWQHFEKIRFTATGDWYKYNMTAEAHPWHTPTLRLSFLAEYNLQDKIIARANIYYLNGQYAKIEGANGPTTVTLKGLVDVNIGFEYRYTKFLSAFINFNNIGAQRYERWYAYPTQKFNLLAGLTYTF